MRRGGRFVGWVAGSLAASVGAGKGVGAIPGHAPCAEVIPGDYFLYNKIVRNPYLVRAQEKVDRALELLARHFDIISVGEHEKFKERIQQFTGWDNDNEEMERKNTYRGEIHFTKRQVENLQKLLETNGDIDFLEKVKVLFGNTIST